MFIEVTGKTLKMILKDDELSVADLEDIGVTDESVIRINTKGDIELRRPEGWDVVGGLLGEYEARVKKATGFEWA